MLFVPRRRFLDSLAVERAVVADEAGGTPGEHHGLEKRIAREAVRAVDTGVTHFAEREQVGKRGPSPLVDVDAAAEIVRRRDDGNRLDGHIDPDLHAARVDVRKPGFQVLAPHMSHVEIDALRSRALHLSIDRAGDHVPRAEVPVLVIVLHKGVPVGPAEHAAFAAQRLGQEKRLRHRVVEPGRMELNELEVGHARAGPVGDRDAVPGRDIGVRRVDIDLARAARREDRPFGRDRVYEAARHIEDVRAVDTAARSPVSDVPLGDESDGHPAFLDADPGVREDSFEEDPLDLLAGEIVEMDDPVRRVTALSRKREASPLACEIDPVRDQILDTPRSFPHHHVDDRSPAEPRAHPERVLDVGLERVLGVDHRSDPPLREGRVGVGRAALRDDADGPAFRGLEREEEARDSAANNEKIGFVHRGTAGMGSSGAARPADRKQPF